MSVTTLPGSYRLHGHCNGYTHHKLVHMYPVWLTPWPLPLLPFCVGGVDDAGVAVGPNLVQWVQGLQHLAAQQQQVRAQRSVLKAARKSNKVGAH